jgi:hypothetical protein
VRKAAAYKAVGAQIVRVKQLDAAPRIDAENSDERVGRRLEEDLQRLAATEHVAIIERPETHVRLCVERGIALRDGRPGYQQHGDDGGKRRNEASGEHQRQRVWNVS